MRRICRMMSTLTLIYDIKTNEMFTVVLNHLYDTRSIQVNKHKIFISYLKPILCISIIKKGSTNIRIQYIRLLFFKLSEINYLALIDTFERYILSAKLSGTYGEPNAKVFRGLLYFIRLCFDRKQLESWCVQKLRKDSLVN